MSKDTQKSLGAIPQYLTRIAPFLLPAIFFQSAIFSFISPLPLFIHTLKNRLWITLLALISNLSILFYTTPQYEVVVAGFFWFSAGVLFPFLIRKSGKIELSFFLSAFYLLILIFSSLSYLAHQANLGLIDYVRAELSLGLDHLIALPDSPVKKMVEDQGRDFIFKQILTEIPSGLVITLLLCFWVNLLFASQLTRGFLSKTFWSSYKNPEWLALPTLICAGLFAFTEHAPYYIGLNGFKILMVLYGFQGLSILSRLLNRYKIMGFPRTLLYFFAIFVTLPLVLSLGFFDLWFDFRRKFGQS